MTGTEIWRATRSAVRCRVPVSFVGMSGSGTRWTLARAMRVPSEARMIAPSIFASSDSRWGVNSASSRNPPEQMLRTVGPVADDDERAHLRLQDAVDALTQRGTRRHEPQRGVKNFRSALRQQILPVGTGSEATPRRTWPRPRAPSFKSATRRNRTPRTSGVDCRHDRVPEPEAQRFGQPARRLRNLADLTAETDLAEDDRVGVDRPFVLGAGDRERDGEVGGGLGHAAHRPRRLRTRPDSPSAMRARCCRTATSIARRFPSNACATRRGSVHLSARPAPAPRRTTAGCPP